MLNIKLRAGAAGAASRYGSGSDQKMRLRLRKTGLTFPIQFRNNLNEKKKEKKLP
jgi:hypothetical protein